MRVVVVALAFALAAVPAQAQSASASRGRLEGLKRELLERRQAVKNLDDKALSLTASMGELDESLSALAQEEEQARARLSSLQAELQRLEREVGTDEAQLAQSKQRLSARLRALYVGGEGGALRALLAAEGFEELALRRRFLQALAESDAKLVSDVVRISDDVKQKRARLREAASDAQETARQLEEQRALLQATREERHLALTRIADERALAFRAEKELVMRHAELAALVNRLAGEAAPSGSSSPRRGRGILKGGLPWPVDGAVIRRFGVTVEKDTRAEIMSNGMEIRAAAGAPVTAVADGRVVHAGWLRGFGIIVIVDHGEGHHTLSAHLSKALVQRGDEVTRGQGIGLVGDTESNNGAKLYFELRERSRPRDPAPFLLRR